jgi:hypothetical protein
MVIAATSPGGLQDTITINSGTKIEDWLSNIQNNLVQTAGKLEFTPKGTDSDSKLVFIPHYSRYKDRYGIYWKLAGTAGGTTTTTVTCPNGNATGGSGGAGGSAGGSGGSTGSGGAAGNSGKGGTSGACLGRRHRAASPRDPASPCSSEQTSTRARREKGIPRR